MASCEVEAFEASGRIQSLAVLPLENLSGDPKEEYFADGMTEALITNLAKISALHVISRTCAMHYIRSASAGARDRARASGGCHSGRNRDPRWAHEDFRSLQKAISDRTKEYRRAIGGQISKAAGIGV
jgi:hypothetical protein